MKTVAAAVTCLGLVLFLAACGTSNPVGSLPVAPGPIPSNSPGFVGMMRAPVNPRLAYINLPLQVTQDRHGNYLVADGGSYSRVASKVVDITPRGRVLWVIYGPGLSFVHSAYATSNDHYLITDTGNNRVIEVNRSGNIDWSSDDLGGGKGYPGQGRLSDHSQLLFPTSAQELPNGHFLITSRLNSTVFEIDRSGHVYLKCHAFINLHGKPDHLSGPYNAHRLPNGDTLIADSGNARVVEVNPSCSREVWEYGGTGPEALPNVIWPRDANLITNYHVNDGHHFDNVNYQPVNDVLIDDSLGDRIIEVTHDSQKRIVEEWDHIDKPYAETVLNNHTFLVGNRGIHGVTAINLAGGIVRMVPTRPPAPLSSEVVNSGFEPDGQQGWDQDDLFTESLPPGVRADMAFDLRVSHGGLSSGRISWTNGPHGPLWWGQAIRVKAGHRYIFQGWVKTQDVGPCAGCDFGTGTPEGSTAYYDLEFLGQGPYKPPPDIVLTKHSGTRGWIEDSTRFIVPAGVTGLNIKAELVGKGTVWFDDVTLIDKGTYHRGNPS